MGAFDMDMCAGGSVCVPVYWICMHVITVVVVNKTPQHKINVLHIHTIIIITKTAKPITISLSLRQSGDDKTIKRRQHNQEKTIESGEDTTMRRI